MNNTLRNESGINAKCLAQLVVLPHYLDSSFESATGEHSTNAFQLTRTSQYHEARISPITWISISEILFVSSQACPRRNSKHTGRASLHITPGSRLRNGNNIAGS